MIIIGCDFHSRFQQIAMLETETGEMTERRVRLYWMLRNASEPNAADSHAGQPVVATGRGNSTDAVIGHPASL